MLRAAARHTARARPLLARARFASTVKYVDTTEDFAKTLTDAGDKLVVVDFTATWCGPCQFIGPKFEQLAGETDGVLFVKVDVDENEDVAQECGISAMPTFHYMKGGKKLAEVVGADPDKLQALIEEHK